MAVKVGISGFGRISRVILRILLQRETDIDVVAINYRKADLKRMKYQLEYDSVFGRLYDQVDIDGDALVVGGKRIPVFTEDDPEKIDWASVGAEYIIEANRMASPNAVFGIYGTILLLYFLVCWPISMLARYLEKKWSN